MRWGEYQNFPSKTFCLTVPKNFVGKPFSASLISGTEKVWIREVGSITIFRRSFCLTVPKNFIGEHFGVSEKFFYRKFSCIGGGGASRFCRIFLSHRTETKSFVKEPSVFGKFSGIEKNLWIREGISRFSVEIFMSHSAENFRKGILLFLRKFLV